MPPPKRKRPIVIKKFPTPATPAPAAPAPVTTPTPPQPVLTPREKKKWKVVSRKDLIGGTMFLLGFGFCIGWFVSDKAHGLEKFMIVAGIILMIFGAHMLSSDPTERALRALGKTAAKVLPGVRRDATDEHPTQGGGE